MRRRGCLCCIFSDVALILVEGMNSLLCINLVEEVRIA